MKRLNPIKWIQWIIIALLRAYQIAVSPLFQPRCRFYPTCSHYAVDSLKKHNLFRALWLTVKRLVKCHPYHPGGYDPVP